ncbi:hypothetical protein R75465_07037 [Paraburkholderia aspalathi]|nr:hypothetical protein R75465_07037 [Paraburkholderia aspalathi]
MAKTMYCVRRVCVARRRFGPPGWVAPAFPLLAGRDERATSPGRPTGGVVS